MLTFTQSAHHQRPSSKIGHKWVSTVRQTTPTTRLTKHRRHPPVHIESTLCFSSKRSQYRFLLKRSQYRSHFKRSQNRFPFKRSQYHSPFKRSQYRFPLKRRQYRSLLLSNEVNTVLILKRSRFRFSCRSPVFSSFREIFKVKHRHQ